MTVACLVAASRRFRGGGRGVVQFVTMEDEAGLVEALLPAGIYQALGDPIRTPGPFLLGGVVIEDHGSIHLRVDRVTPFHRRPQPYVTG